MKQSLGFNSDLGANQGKKRQSDGIQQGEKERDTKIKKPLRSGKAKYRRNIQIGRGHVEDEFLVDAAAIGKSDVANELKTEKSSGSANTSEEWDVGDTNGIIGEPGRLWKKERYQKPSGEGRQQSYQQDKRHLWLPERQGNAFRTI